MKTTRGHADGVRKRSDAVRCPVTVQRGMAERDAELLLEKRIELRVGINVGDTMLDGGDTLATHAFRNLRSRVAFAYRVGFRRTCGARWTLLSRMPANCSLRISGDRFRFIDLYSTGPVLPPATAFDPLLWRRRARHGIRMAERGECGTSAGPGFTI